MTAISAHWWSASPHQLATALAHVNTARRRDDPTEACEYLAHSLNQLWIAYWQTSPSAGPEGSHPAEASPGDYSKLKRLVTEGIGADGQCRLAGAPAVGLLVGLEPMVMDHNRLNKLGYDPLQISDRYRHQASEEHRRLRKAWQRSQAEPNPSTWLEVVQKTAQLLYIIRSNIAHGEKTLRGPDREATTRNAAVCRTSRPAFEAMIDEVLDRPSQRLAVYGTLKPGGANFALLEPYVQLVRSGQVAGHIRIQDGLSFLEWSTSGEPVDVQVIEGPALAEQYESLDRMEGNQYQRILVPAQTDTGVIVANTYSAPSLA